MRVDGNAVRAAREAQGISQERLAAKVGVSSDTIWRVEQNRGDVAAGTAYLIAVELGVDLKSIFTSEAVA
jgi:transcriptional regulator with XRE-family HTH domain